MNAITFCFRPAAAAALAVGLLWPGSLLASTASALREYKQGKYDQSLKDYQHLLERQADDARLHFNAGAAAYRDKQLDEAAKQFDEAANASDLKLQGMAYYNRGNTLYYLGDQNSDPSKREDAWKKSVQDFQNSLKLNPQDPDAKYNLDFVKKKLEDLKQQQPPPQQKGQDQKQDQKQDQEQGQQNQKQDQQNQPQQKQDQEQQQQQQDQQQQQKDQQQQQQQGQPKQPDQSQQDQQKQGDQQQAQPAGQPQDQKQPPKEAAGQQEGSDQKDQDQEAGAVPAGQMTPEQARQLLDAQKGDEMVLPANPKRKPADVTRPFKDW